MQKIAGDQRDGGTLIKEDESVGVLQTHGGALSVQPNRRGRFFSSSPGILGNILLFDVLLL